MQKGSNKSFKTWEGYTKGYRIDSDSGDDDELFSGSSGNVARTYDAHDGYHDHSDGGDSWHSLEMKRPPNSEDVLEEVESHHVLPVFKEGARYGEIQLEVGMKINTKKDFREAVREYCI
ncbi:hypothetical protein PIB30_055158 [Stylosanthes scabra]|uniref:Uncharacterized protein n=1 Tax=Stylosanthes scabra TaxID=79078 RepID=A0ABU6SIV2_9FABA|nr:hypothetical protein [Stylosanthes scabra]